MALFAIPPLSQRRMNPSSSPVFSLAGAVKHHRIIASICLADGETDPPNTRDTVVYLERFLRDRYARVLEEDIPVSLKALIEQLKRLEQETLPED